MTNGNDPINQIPYINKDGTIQHDVYIGLTKREYFAAMAMHGLIANAPNGHLSNSKEGVQLATDWADSLIKALNEKP